MRRSGSATTRSGIQTNSKPARLTAWRLRRRRRRVWRAMRGPRRQRAAPGDVWLAIQFLDHCFLLAREGVSPDLGTEEGETDVVMVRLADADVRQLADVRRQTKVDDRRLQIQRHAVVALERCQFQLEGIDRQVGVCSEVG